MRIEIDGALGRIIVNISLNFLWDCVLISCRITWKFLGIAEEIEWEWDGDGIMSLPRQP